MGSNWPSMAARPLFKLASRQREATSAGLDTPCVLELTGHQLLVATMS
jgi:hypothetical protein